MVKAPLLFPGVILPVLLITHITCSFFAEAQRIAAEDYVPSIEDIGHASETGVMETHFNLDQYSIRISQLYGQRGYFRKWIPLFEGVTSVMFCALSLIMTSLVFPAGADGCVSLLYIAS